MIDSEKRKIYRFNMACPICHDPLLDPRVLPCGHSYCPPTEPCLNFLQKDPGVLTCSICRAEHRILISSLKPLFEIRDVLQRAHQGPLFKPPQCDYKLCSNLVGFWCKDCKTAICDDCLEDKHGRHLIVSFKTYLKQEIKQKLGTRSVREQLDELQRRG